MVIFKVKLVIFINLVKYPTLVKKLNNFENILAS